MKRVTSATDARIHFGELMRRVVEDNVPVFVERGGKAQVVILSVAEYERLSALQQPKDWRYMLRRLHERILAESGGRPLPPVEDIIREMREERDAQLLDLR